jgi:nucleotide-binding universal stress UspA family protein
MGTDTLPSARQPSVELLLPATWHRVDLDPETRAASIARLVKRTTRQGSEFANGRAQMRVEFERAAEIGVSSGATLAFVFWSVTDGKLASASLFVALIDASHAPEDGAMEPQALAEALAARYGGEATELDAGPAARVRRRRPVPEAWAGSTGKEAEIVTWYVPHESGRRLAVLTFSTPNVGLADEFGEVFDALADTLRWTA